MDEFKLLAFDVCTMILLIELISVFFPGKEGRLVRGIAVLSVISVLLSGMLQQDWSALLDTEDFSLPDLQTFEAQYAKTGAELLKERLSDLLLTAGIETAEEKEDIEIRYRQDDAGKIEIDGVYVRIRYPADRDRTYALLRSVLTDAVPLCVDLE